MLLLAFHAEQQDQEGLEGEAQGTQFLAGRVHLQVQHYAHHQGEVDEQTAYQSRQEQGDSLGQAHRVNQHSGDQQRRQGDIVVGQVGHLLRHLHMVPDEDEEERGEQRDHDQQQLVYYPLVVHALNARVAHSGAHVLAVQAHPLVPAIEFVLDVGTPLHRTHAEVEPADKGQQLVQVLVVVAELPDVQRGKHHPDGCVYIPVADNSGGLSEPHHHHQARQHIQYTV